MNYFIVKCLFRSNVCHDLDFTEMRFLRILQVHDDCLRLKLMENRHDGVYITPEEDERICRRCPEFFLEMEDFYKVFGAESEVLLFRDGIVDVYALEMQEYRPEYNYTGISANPRRTHSVHNSVLRQAGNRSAYNQRTYYSG